MSLIRRKRPGTVTVLLVIQALNTICSLALLLLFRLDPVFYSTGYDAMGEAFSRLLISMGVSTAVSLVIFLLLLLGNKVGFFLAAIGYASNLFFSPTGFSTIGVILAVICLFLLLCGPSRRYFGIGKSAQSASGTSTSSGSGGQDPWDRPGRQ